MNIIIVHMKILFLKEEKPYNKLCIPSRHTTSEQRYYNVILTFKRRFNVHTKLF